MNAQKTDLIDDDFKGCSLIITFDDEKIEYRFASLIDLEKNLEGILIDRDYFDKEDNKKERKLIVELRLVTIKDNIRNITSEKITTDCLQNKITIAIIKLKSVILAAIDEDTVCQMGK